MIQALRRLSRRWNCRLHARTFDGFANWARLSIRSGVLSAGGESRGTVYSEGCYRVVNTAGVPDGRLVRWWYAAKRPRHQLHW